MALKTSIWLNLSFVEKILRKSENDNSIKVTDIFSKPATSKGDNHTSDMIRITAEYSRDQGSCKIKEKKSIILKILPELGSVKQKFVIESGLFHTETSMMSNTLNKMNKLLEPKYRLSGKTLYVQNEDPMLMAIEDLASLGFRMADRLSGLDLDHSILASCNLARFHAASVALCEKEPKQKEIYSLGTFNEQQSSGMKDIFIKSTKGLADVIAHWPEVKKYSEKIAKLSDHIYQIGIDATKLRKEEFNVITHGDFHVNNMLFRYNNDGKPIDHIFVDFQMCVYATPVLDLLLFLNTSPSLDVMENKKNILLNEYLDTLSATMKELNCKTQAPTMEELKATIKRKTSYEMIVLFVILPFVLCSKAEPIDMDELLSTGINPGFKSEIYKILMIKRLPLYDEWGLLDLNSSIPISISKMDLETLTWLNLCFVEKILRNSESDNSIQVTDISLESVTSKGDNYTSDIIRIIVDFSYNQDGLKNTEKKSIIIKISPTLEGDRKKLVTQLDCFHNEALMMSDTLNKMNKLLEPNHRLSGKILYVQNENPTLLVIEDLAPLGFRMADRSSGLDLAHSVLALRGLARFHAASVALCEKEPNQKEMYLKGTFNKQHPPEMKDIFIKSTKALADEIANWPEVKKYSKKIAKLSDHIYEIGINASKLFEDEFNVINHGDFQMNNILFKYIVQNNDSKPIDYIFVDFQMCVYGSPALDLHGFLNSSPSPDVIENKRHFLLNEYLDTLSATMKQLNCKTHPPSMKELKAILKRRASFGMIISFTVLPYMLRCQTETDLNEIISTGTFIYPKSESFKQLMIKRLPLYDKWGLLDL
ncbi:uncharacterized protein [Mycetomoellerius zeteki]|uniref:uncharacterized protein n=1 Tax=Mycetomoellerius zeteki TaxID=64791 RepID=UPI00084E3C48|nr:PREDICTED: uncharacterized protein LOC108725026 [Trachymyrmex zeteki]